MLRELSIRNVKRQSKDYRLYFITLICTAAFMYAFNALIFSDSIKILSGLEILPFLIVAASLLIVLVMGWIISYMTNYMLKKRSRELSIYMMAGITNRAVGTLVFYENALTGALAFLLGLPLGMLLAQLLEAVLLHMLGLAYSLRFPFQPLCAGLTLLYFVAMLLYSLGKNRRWIRRVKLYDLLCHDRQNEKILLSGGAPAAGVFCLSVLLGCAGLALMYAQPLGNGYDALCGFICLMLFLFGFFMSVPSFLAARFGNRDVWKYRKNRLVTFRDFTNKIRSMSIVMGILSVLFMLSITFMGLGTAICMIADKNVEMSVFDIIILHRGEAQDASCHEEMLRSSLPVLASHTYSIYTDTGKELLTVRSRTLSDMGRPDYPVFAEFQYDTYMRQSDYQRLREMLGYEAVELDPSLCYVHCVPALEEGFRDWIRQEDKPERAGFFFAADGVFTEPFGQMEAYGNGLDYIAVIPDQAVTPMEILYSLCAVVTEAPLNGHDLRGITESCEGLEPLRRNIGKSVPGSGAATALIKDVDYLSGKWVDKENLSRLYAMSVCLFYLALILEITGAAILATQVLGDRDKKEGQNIILRQLGMNGRLIASLNGRRLTLLFLFPVLPALAVSSALVYIGGEKIHQSAFALPAFAGPLWIAQAYGISLIFFGLLYGVYYAAARIYPPPACGTPQGDKSGR